MNHRRRLHGSYLSCSSARPSNHLLKVRTGPITRKLGRFIGAGLAVILLAGLALAGAAAAQSASLPTQPPDAAEGLATFSERCSNCHGERALGDGELASPEYMRTAVPALMFETVTNGRVENGMPPFGPVSTDPLSDEERWNALAAVFSLGTPLESVEQGQASYEASCLACHGENGQGDGPEAAGLATPAGDLSAVDYWFNTSNQAVFDTLSGDQITAHEFDLTEDELWSIIDYMRTLSYGYVDALAAFRPLEAGAIGGLVTNGSRADESVTDGTVRLSAFTRDLEVTLTMSNTLDADGRYQFEVTDVPQDWFYRVGVEYNGIEFGSDFGQLSFVEPELDLPVTVYEKSSNPGAISIGQLHIVLQFFEGQVQVSELYVANNNEAAVFIGENSDADQGTFTISVPENAQGLDFQRGFGSLDSFVPANEVVQTASGWADTLPVRPGPNSLTLLASYFLPYEEGATISHPLNYAANAVNLVMPDVGVELDPVGNWVSGGQQTLESGSFISYGQADLSVNSTLTLNLTGKPRQTTNTTGSLVRDNATELLIGGGVALIAVAIGAFALRQWRAEPVEIWDEEELLQSIADLDDEFDAGLILEAEYLEEREALKEELLALWEEEADVD
jgi:mono/diheme cytochrome c family protein